MPEALAISDEIRKELTLDQVSLWTTGLYLFLLPLMREWMLDMKLKADCGAQLHLDFNQIGDLMHQGAEIELFKVQRKLPHLELCEVL